MGKVSGASTGVKPATVESSKTVSTTPDLKSAKPPELAQKPAEIPEKPLTEQNRTQRKQEKQMSGVMKQAAFQGALKGKESYALGSKDSTVSGQAKYGPTADITKQQQEELKQHYGARENEKGSNPLERQTQYDKKHSTYVKAAEQTGRPLTEQEAVAKATGKNAPDASINHVIASGTGQNILNEGTLQFKQGQKTVNEKYKTAVSDPKNSSPETVSAAQKEVRSGIAQQASAAGRMQGYSREILKERQGEKGIDVGKKRNETLQGTLKAFQGKTPEERMGAYKNVLKETFDSPGNLRVGDSSANTKVSTGFDAPLDATGKPTEKSERLLHTHKTFAPDRLLTDERLFTKDSEGKIMSSSQEVKEKKKD